MSTATADRRYTNFVIALLLAFPIVINSVKILGNLILLILVVLGAYIAITERQNPFRIPELKLLSWLTTGYFMVMLVSILIADGWDAQPHHLGRKLHFLLTPLIALAIYKIDLPIRHLLTSLKVGLILIGLITLMQFGLGESRPSGMINANIFGDLAVAMLFLSAVRLFSENSRERWLTIIALLFGFSAVLLSGSRGSWLSFVILFVVYIGLAYGPFLKGNRTRQGFLVLCMAAILTFVGTQTQVSEKVSHAVANIQNWDAGESTYTSSGVRMEMWQAGIEAFKHSPWVGYGYRNANEEIAKYADNHQRIIAGFTHLHNEYLTNLVSSGLIGLIALLTLLTAPMIVCFRRFRKTADPHAMMGVLLCVGYATFGFTHIAFGEEHMNAFYTFSLSLVLPGVLKKSVS